MTSQRVLLINPTITSQRRARFPLAMHEPVRGARRQVPIDDHRRQRRSRLRRRPPCAPSTRGPSPRWALPSWEDRSCCSAIAVSKAIRERLPAVPIIWGGAFPTVCPEAALNAPYVDYAVRATGRGHAR